MHMMFLDESGSVPSRADAAGRFLAIGGVIVRGDGWHMLASRFVRILEAYGVKGEIKWRNFGRGSPDPKSAIDHLDLSRRDRLRRELFSLLVGTNAVKLIAAYASLDAAFERRDVKTRDDIYHLVYRNATARFQYFLQDASRQQRSRQVGMIICDHRMSTDDEKLRIHHHELVEGRGDFSINYRNLVETMQFSPSHFSVGLQLADLVAGAVGRHHNSNDPTFVEMLRPAFRTGPDGQISGYGVVRVC